MRLHREHAKALATSLIALLVVAASLNVIRAPFASAGAPLYPDLQTATPANLWIDHIKLSDGKYHYLLRFDNEIDNIGGRLEITADLSVSRDLYQNVYDSLIGGTQVEHRRMTSDLIFHPTHNHFHVSDLANYSLYKQAASGVYRNTTKRGSKTSFCILDSVKVLESATNRPTYTECNAKKQGLSAGWGDIYTSTLPDQWIDLGSKMLADGSYALHSTADPYNRIKETNDGNNTAITRFTIKNGALAGASNPEPYCSAKPNPAPTGAAVYVSCEQLTASTSYEVRWRYENGDPIATALSDELGELATQFVMPETPRGAHYLYLTGGSPVKTVRIVIDTAPSIVTTVTEGKVGQRVQYSLTGFSSSSAVTILYEQAEGVWLSAGSATTNSKGSGAGSFVIPSSVAGSHIVRASEDRKSDPAIATITVLPELRLQVDTATAGSSVQVRLRGFGRRDTVVLKLQENGATLGQVKVSNTGAADPNIVNAFVVPSKLKAGTYHIVATGTSGATTTATIVVTAVSQSDVPAVTPTPSPTPSATATATQSPVPPTAASTDTATAEPTATSTPEAIPTIDPPATAEPEATDSPAAPTG